MRVQVSVTESDIRGGVRDDDCLCPVALALRRVTGEEVCVCSEQIGLGSLGRGYVFQRVLDTPRAVRDFVDAFDGGRSVEPFEFELDVPLA